MPYQPIEDYGIIGNLRTAALVGRNGSIDWFCYPRFDSPSILGAILDDKKGGFYKICPIVEDVACKQFYWPDTNVLLTRFLGINGVGEIIDFMPIRLGAEAAGSGSLIRIVRVLRGSMRFRLECNPAFNYARDSHKIRIVHDGAHFIAPALDLALQSSIRLQHFGAGVAAEFTLSEGKSRSFALHELGKDKPDIAARELDHENDRLFQETVEYWRRWVSKSTYQGRWREMVQRSAL